MILKNKKQSKDRFEKATEILAFTGLIILVLSIVSNSSKLSADSSIDANSESLNGGAPSSTPSDFNNSTTELPES